MTAVLDIITPEQLAALREAGWVVIHREPTDAMGKAFYAKQWPEMVVFKEGYHRVVATSIRQQQADAALAEELDEDDSEPDFSSARTGDICSRSGDIKGHPIGSGYGITSYGEVHVSPEQADAAAAYGWKRVNKRERDPARVLIRR